MLQDLGAFLIHWALTAASLWAASLVFRGIRFSDSASLWLAALALGFVNAIVRPILIVLTLPLTVLTLGLFLLVINALMLLWVSRLIRGFSVSGFWTALFASLFISGLSFLLGELLFAGELSWHTPAPMHSRPLWV